MLIFINTLLNLMEAFPPGRLKVLLCSVPASGHYIPLLHLAEALRAKPQFEVLFACSTYELPKIAATNPQLRLFGLDDPHDKLFANVEKMEYIPLYYFDEPWR